MNLKIQLYSLVYSFIFGLVFSLLVKLNYKFLFCRRKYIQILINFIFMFIVSFLYFIGNIIINNGVLHIYFLFVLLLGWYVGTIFLVKFLKK